MADSVVPDFTQVTHHLDQAAAEFSRQFQLLNTTPAVQLQQITVQLQQLNQQMQQQNQQFHQQNQQFQQQFQQLQQQNQQFQRQLQQQNQQFQQQLQQQNLQSQQQFQQLNQRITAIDTKLDASNSNTVARLQNCHAKSSEDELTPLVNSRTGFPVPHFPDNSQAINELTANQCKAMLRELGHVVPQNQAVAFLRRQIRIQIGAPADQFNVI